MTHPRRLPLLARSICAALFICIAASLPSSAAANGLQRGDANTQEADLVIVGATPAGIMAAVAAARASNCTAKIVILERTHYIGGLPANGLGATDIATFGATGGLFLEFVGRVKKHYVDTYGVGSKQVRDSVEGYHFEPKVAEAVLAGFLDEVKQSGAVEVKMQRQLDVDQANVEISGRALKKIRVLNRDTGAEEWYAAKVGILYMGPLRMCVRVLTRSTVLCGRDV